MGRSVSYPTNCSAVCFRIFETDLEDPDSARFEWEWFVDWIKETANGNWKSFCDTDKWIGGEDHAILENCHGYIGVSEYCGLVAVWLKAKDEYPNDHPELSLAWCDSIASKFGKLFGEYRKVATASNGEAFYEKCDA